MKILTIFIVFLSLVMGKKLIVVDLTTQEAYAYEDDRLIMRGEVSTGKVGHRTPTGEFKILEKKPRHTSSKYPEPNGGARMDYMMRLTYSGIAMHLGFVPNYPASHGCIRLKNGFAQRLYAWASVGTKVIIEGNPPTRVTRGKNVTNPPLNYPISTPIVNDSLQIYHKKLKNPKLSSSKLPKKAKVLVFDDMQGHSYNYNQSSHKSNYYYKYDSHKGKNYTRKVIRFDDLSY